MKKLAQKMKNQLLLVVILTLSSSSLKLFGQLKLDYYYTWGLNNSGQLGLGSQTSHNNPKLFDSFDLSTIKAGNDYVVAIKKDGSLWAWGNNSYKQLGLGDSVNRSTPTQVGSDKDWLEVAVGTYHTLAIKKDGTLWSWGTNDYGQLGLGNTLTYSSPKQIGSDTNWLNIAAGRDHSLAVKKDGTLWAWGDNDYAQLGLGNKVSHKAPQQVGPNKTWKSVYAGDIHSMALTKTGTLFSWGDNSYGQLGLIRSFVINLRKRPNQVGDLSIWAAIDVGGYHNIAIKKDGTLWAWGNNGYGQLGLGTTVDEYTPKRIGNSSNWVKTSAGANHTHAIQTDGSLWGWGYNDFGQLGLSNNLDFSSPQKLSIGGSECTFIELGSNFTIAKLKCLINNYKAISSNDTIVGFVNLKSKNNKIKTYLWSTGATTNEISVNRSGLYSLYEVDSNGCTGKSEVFIKECAIPNFIKVSNSDTIVGLGLGLTLKSKNLKINKYSWSNGSNQSKIIVTQPGKYTLTEIDSNGCIGLSSVEIKDCNIGNYKSQKDTVLGEGKSIMLSSTNSGIQKYLWSTGDTVYNAVISSIGSYRLTEVDSNNCKGISQFSVSYCKIPNFVGLSSTDTIVASGISANVESKNSNIARHKWSTGQETSKITVSNPVRLSLLEVDTNGCHGNSSVFISFCEITSPSKLYSRDTIVVYSGSFLLQSKNTKIENYYWSTGERSEKIVVKSSGNYSLLELDSFGCRAEDNIVVYFKRVIGCNRVRLESPISPKVKVKWSTGDSTNYLEVLKSGIVTLTLTDSNANKTYDTTFVQLVNEEISIARDTILCNVMFQDTLKLNLTNWFRNTDYNYYNNSKDQVNTTNNFINKIGSINWSGFAALKSNPNVKCPISGQITPYLSYPRLVNKFTDTIKTITNTLKPAILSKQYSKYTWSNGETAFTTKFNNSGKHWFRHSSDTGCSQTDSFHFSRINLTVPTRITAKFGSKITLKVKDSLNTSSYVAWSTGDTGWYTVYTVTNNTDTIFATQHDAYRSVTKFTVITGRLEPIRTIEEYDNLDNDSTGNNNAQNNTAGIEVSSVNTIRIYPNPVGSEITLDGLIHPSNYEIHTVTGQLVQSGKTSPKINVENLQTGLYLLKLENISVKFVKE